MIVATFNVENLFDRPRAMNLPDWSEGQPALNAAGELNALFNKRVYTAVQQRRMLHLLKKFDLLAARPNNAFLTLRTVRGALLERKQGKAPRIVATGRDSWTGWIELKREQIADAAIANTARVIAEVRPDILVLVELESRPALQHFHDKVLSEHIAKPYAYNMVIDGNDERGIDVGILSRYPIQRMRSHITDRASKKAKGPAFSRDCPEYYVELPSGRELLILPNHFASKGSDPIGKRRRLQAACVRRIYQSLHKKFPLAIVAGDLNDHPRSGALDSLLKRTQLVDAMSLKQYRGSFPGTYQHATANEKIDYLLLSPALQRKSKPSTCSAKAFTPRESGNPSRTLTSRTRSAFRHRITTAFGRQSICKRHEYGSGFDGLRVARHAANSDGGAPEDGRREEALDRVRQMRARPRRRNHHQGDWLACTFILARSSAISSAPLDLNRRYRNVDHTMRLLRHLCALGILTPY